MIILRQSLFTSAASFKPKFRARFRNGDFTYSQAKDPKNEALNHQAYKEVAEEPEFRNNPETYKIRQGMFSKSHGSSYPGNQPTYQQKRKFRERFRKGNFKYSKPKYPELEASNLAAYIEVAGEDEFKNSSKARQIHYGGKIFSQIDVNAEDK